MSSRNFLGFILGIVIIVAVTAITVPLTQTRTAQGAAPSGLYSTVATSGPILVSTTASTVIATSTSCAARIISTNNSAVKLTFGDADGDVPTGTNGIWQAASTTEAYDGGIFGCGAVKIYSYVAQTVNATETQ